MKNTLIYLLIVGLVLGCTAPDNTINDIFDNVQQGAVLRTISSKGDYNFYAPDQSVFELTIEEHDIKNGGLMENVEVFLSHNGGTEVLHETLLPSAFTTGPTGLPRTDISLSLAAATSALGLSSSQYTGGDKITIRLKLNLTDGRSFSSEGATGSLTGSYFSSPFSYDLVIKCIPLAAVPGIYTFNMKDSFEDGWQGSHIKVTVDGTSTYYAIPSSTPYAVSLAPYSGNDAGGKASLTIPEGAKTMTFEWVSGEYPEECSYTIEYTKLDGSGKQTTIEESNPSEGEKTLSICN
jgi:hypothetical protein